MDKSIEYKLRKYNYKLNQLKQIGGVQSIMVRLDGQWVEARNYQAHAFKNFIKNGEQPYKYDDSRNGIIFTIQRENNQQIYIIRNDGTRMPIADWNNVQVFLLDAISIGWYPARDYQTWAYFDFLYSNDIERHYKSLESDNIDSNIRYTTIDVPNLYSNIVFRMSRNDNGTIFYEKNNDRTRVRISDNAIERAHYLNNYNLSIAHSRITQTPSVRMRIDSPRAIDTLIQMKIEKTSNDDEMCCICNDNKKNIQFLPCKHDLFCSECCTALFKHNKTVTCPLCRANVIEFTNISPPPTATPVMQQPPRAVVRRSVDPNAISVMRQEYSPRVLIRRSAEPSVDSNALKQLEQMGFNRSVSESALIATKNNVELAINIILSNAGINLTNEQQIAVGRRVNNNNMSPPAVREITPVIPSVAPPAVRGVAPPAVRGAAPPAVRGAAPPAVRGAAPPAVRGVAPQVIPSVAPQVIPSVAPQVIPSVAPQVIPSVAPLVIPSVAPLVKAVQQSFKPIHPISDDWFERAFGFEEQSYTNAKEKFNRMIIEGKNTHLNGIKIGTFKILNAPQLYSQLVTGHGIGRVTIRNIGNTDIRSIHRNPELSTNATIQVASQFNCLEMASQRAIPEDGITIYEHDRTQGPICAMSAPAGLAYRNYLYNGGQTKDKQIDETAELLNYLKEEDRDAYWKIQNGYLMFDNDIQLRTINSILANSPIIRRNARNLIQCASHSDQGVFITGKETHTVNHVYCSGLPISSTYNKLPADLWDGLAELFLEAMYENTLLIACINNMKSGQNKPCYLTQVGGGVFGMKQSQIVRAITRACNILSMKGLSIDVIIVHYSSVDTEYNIFNNIQFPLTNIQINSVWDDENGWVNRSILQQQ
ncbi:RING-finger domain containing protein [Bodo saltans virus]|uniref:RING-finger domain containing protein n=1 Tax=Bodo saltans virus TaxID=2024608 RepID=A0A2H4UUF0_9VIRU|nr:RING-finger domain containing protein [Bodo saltans virus]ATZ80561.1 RING-finger domain containing protein [Bodo saltans virus]